MVQYIFFQVKPQNIQVYRLMGEFVLIPYTFWTLFQLLNIRLSKFVMLILTILVGIVLVLELYWNCCFVWENCIVLVLFPKSQYCSTVQFCDRKLKKKPIFLSSLIMYCSASFASRYILDSVRQITMS